MTTRVISSDKLNIKHPWRVKRAYRKHEKYVKKLLKKCVNRYSSKDYQGFLDIIEIILNDWDTVYSSEYITPYESDTRDKWAHRMLLAFNTMKHNDTAENRRAFLDTLGLLFQMWD